MLDRLKRFRYAIAILVGIVLIGGMIVEAQFQIIRRAPEVDRTDLMERPAIQIVVRPEHAPDLLHRLAEDRAGRSIPRWAWNRFMAHELGVMISEETDDGKILIGNYASLPYAAAFVSKHANRMDLHERVSEISWTDDAVHTSQFGLVTLDGHVVPDDEAIEAVFYQWGDGRILIPLTVTGDHFFELVFDNRSGQAYLAMASLMAAFDFDLDAQETDITLSSFQFVITMRLFVDVVEGDVFEVAMDVDIEPAARNRIGVINLKGGVDELFSELDKKLQKERGITITGDSSWNETTIEYRYRISPATEFVNYMLDRD